MERACFVNALPSIIATAHILDGLQLTTRRTGVRSASGSLTSGGIRF
jgi:hypothetical protein